MSCLIDIGASVNCSTISAGGIRKYVMLYNWSEWRSMVDGGDVTFDSDGMITDIVNATSVQAYKFEVPDESGVVPSNPLIEQEGNIDMYDHQLNLSVFGDTQALRNNIDRMRVENVVAIIYQNNGKGSVYGNEQGMKLITNNFNPQDPVMGNIIPIELKTSNQGAKETRMPATIFKTDAATTEALILGLTTVGV